MSFILHLECATKICSVALSKSGELIEYIDVQNEELKHNELLTILIDQLIQNQALHYSDIQAVSLSSGPGSYTGLRIAVSVAKGLCYALQVPLISIETNLCLYYATKLKYPNHRILTMIDARRMEVYSCMYENDVIIKELSADILDENSYIEFNQIPLIAVGDGIEKCKILWKNRNIIFDDEIQLSAQFQTIVAWEKFKLSQFESVAYFEPLYLKEFFSK
ncbi:MAG: tRNA (adenosine(37)-N6)-threonylcarbamoyltransferase complex dimerization subunit type 1 TsaB [Flavobacteriia bacterium]|nr:tRNA (adenosine(37)-N6)-threonylcarbamoyltransferase complex dimerization subunit type 1 TsaB [Flavobacteriia bacterium]